MDDKIPIIDLFAGPGGLGEGFSSFPGKGRKGKFKIALSIEKDPVAHKTLELRALYRNLVAGKNRVPEKYYAYLRRELSRSELFACKRGWTYMRHPSNWEYTYEKKLDEGRINSCDESLLQTAVWPIA